jgi:uncharacterized protein YjcR
MRKGNSMNCEVDWIRLTKYGAWKSCSKPRGESLTPEKPADLSPVLTVRQIAEKYKVPVHTALKWHKGCATIDQRLAWIQSQVAEHGEAEVAASMGVQIRTIRKRQTDYKRLLGNQTQKDLAKQIYNEYISGIPAKNLAEKYGRMVQSIRNSVTVYAKRHGLPLLKDIK